MLQTDGDSGRATYRIVVEYDGTNFAGFQFQPRLRTIAGELERALSTLFDEPIKLTAAGRTDTGVHAVGQVVSFTAHDRFPIDRLAIALNSNLPDDLSAREAARVAPRFSARNHAMERRYTYAVLSRPAPSAVLRRFVHHEYRPLGLEPMRRAAADLVGERDFVSFCGVLPDRGPTIRTLHEIAIARTGEIVRFHYRGSGFLHRMVRIMTGTLLEIGAGRRPADAIPAILAARDRRLAGATAPPHGLYLVGVRYPDFDSAPRDSPLLLGF
ncbi:MAG: tRNA pseudouridine(38-40) synthase TruA [Vulcanimicrobiaceae bacterium]